jgi:hypothetical protein
MLPDRHPADELDEIRYWISKLRARERELVAALAADPSLRRGKKVRAVLHRRERREFLEDRLPPAILGNPAYWAVTEDREVVTEPLSAPRRERVVFSSARKMAAAAGRPAKSGKAPAGPTPVAVTRPVIPKASTWFSLGPDDFHWRKNS